MKIIVCGGGSVGKSIVSYLVKGNNDVIVIDRNQTRLDEIAKEYDVLPILGDASHPDVLERAGVKNADIILAVTNIDEVNMVICQVAHTLFGVVRKIARIDNEAFLDPIWGVLFNEQNIPIDLIISPDMEIAENILRILRFPGCFDILPVLGEEAYILTLKVPENCPLVNMPIMQFSRSDSNFDAAVVNILRGNKCFLPQLDDTLKVGDEINLIVKKDAVYNTITSFGLENPTNERLVIFGGNKIAEYLGTQIEHDDTVVSCKIIESDIDNARRLAKDLSHVIVIHGEMMSDVILSEADINHADACIAVTTNDKDNLLASLLSSKRGVNTPIAVVNTPSYNSLMDDVGNNVLVDRSSITISKLLKEIRKTKMTDAYSLSRGLAETWEIKITEETGLIGKRIRMLNLPVGSRIIAIKRENELIYSDNHTLLQNGDDIILYVESTAVRQVEKIFA
ncbi:MAG: Trk system potassium transporter TrkA [Alphaproteobacteria bacterium]|nr:Trk system potassium transporter TrkA [Alphaproteobacteria bacterium]